MKRDELKEWLLKKLEEGGRTMLYSEYKKSVLIQDSIKEYTKFLKENTTLPERTYCIVNNILENPKCFICGNITSFNKNKFSYGKYCSSICIGKDPERINKIKKTSLEKYGVDNPSKSFEVKEKIRDSHFQRYDGKYNTQTEEFKEYFKETCLKKYGVDNPSKSFEVKQRIKEAHFQRYDGKYNTQTEEFKKDSKETCLKKYRVEHPVMNIDIKNKISNTIDERYGKRWYVETNEFKQKFLESSLEKYGEINPSMNIDVKNKVKKTCEEKYGSSSYLSSEKHKNFMLDKWGIEYPFHGKYKDYILPSGEIVKIQGYENFALDILLKKYDEKDILVKGKDIRNIIGKVIYNHNNKGKQYLMDIYLIPENKVIEVKSEFTLYRTLEVNLLKRQACLDMGLKYEFWVFNNTGNLKIIG